MATIQTAKSFAKIMEEMVLPLRENHPEWICLGGPYKSGYPTVFVKFRYAFRDWMIKSDTQIDKLLVAYDLQKEGEKPFVISKTEKGNLCLRLSNQDSDAPDGLYIYQVED